MHCLQAESSCSKCPEHEIDMVTKRIRTAEINSLSKEERQYISASTGVKSIEPIDALHVAMFKAECECLSIN